jgi:hypothetical protein
MYEIFDSIKKQIWLPYVRKTLSGQLHTKLGLSLYGVRPRINGLYMSIEDHVQKKTIVGKTYMEHMAKNHIAL